MDISTIAKKNSHLQQHAANNLFDIFALLQGHGELSWGYWVHKIGINNEMQAAVDQFWKILKNERSNRKKLMNDCFTNMEVGFQEFLQRQ